MRTIYKIARDAYHVLLERISNKVDASRDDIKKMVDHISTNFTGEITAIGTTSIPLNPKKVNFKLVAFWENEPWQAIKNKSGVKDTDSVSPVLSLFMEDEFGQPVSDDVKKEVRGDIAGYWTDVHNSDEDLGNWKEIGFKRREDFRKTMEGKYNWLRLCEGHWKTKQLWVNYFPSWKTSNLPPTVTPTPADNETPSPDPDAGEGETPTSTKTKGKTPTSAKTKGKTPTSTKPKGKTPANAKTKGKAPGSSKIKSDVPIELTSDEDTAPDDGNITAIVISSDEDDISNSGSNSPIVLSSGEEDVPIGAKRRREGGSEPGPGPSKKFKGKAKEVVASSPPSNSRPARPVPTKKGKANVAKVSEPTFPSA